MDIANAKACNFKTFIDTQCDGNVWRKYRLRLIKNVVAQQYVSIFDEQHDDKIRDKVLSQRVACSGIVDYTVAKDLATAIEKRLCGDVNVKELFIKLYEIGDCFELRDLRLRLNDTFAIVVDAFDYRTTRECLKNAWDGVCVREFCKVIDDTVDMLDGLVGDVDWNLIC